MNFKHLLSAGAFALATCAQAATVVDTGTPGGSAVGAYAFDASDWFAAEITLASAGAIDAIYGHVLGGAAGETFTISLYAADAGNVPGSPLHTATATFGTDGWNGVSGLSGWNVNAGSYWVGIEVQPDGMDTLGDAGGTTLLDTGAASPLATWAFSSDSGWNYSALGTASIGLRVSEVPEPACGLLLLAGLPLVAAAARRRSTRKAG